MCKQLTEIDLKTPYTRINPFRATGYLAEEIVHDKKTGGRGTVEIDPDNFVFDKNSIRIELRTEDFWPYTLHTMIHAKGAIQTGEAAWKKGAQAFILTSRGRCRSYGMDPDDIGAIEARLKEEIEVYYGYLNQHENSEDTPPGDTPGTPKNPEGE